MKMKQMKEFLFAEMRTIRVEMKAGNEDMIGEMMCSIYGTQVHK
jgi:hypothetical protein